jgi:hypothetical protein
MMRTRDTTAQFELCTHTNVFFAVRRLTLACVIIALQTGEASAQGCAIAVDNPNLVLSESVDYSKACLIRFVVTTQLSWATAATCWPVSRDVDLMRLRLLGEQRLETALTLDSSSVNMTYISNYSSQSKSECLSVCLKLERIDIIIIGPRWAIEVFCV